MLGSTSIEQVSALGLGTFFRSCKAELDLPTGFRKGSRSIGPRKGPILDSKAIELGINLKIC